MSMVAKSQERISNAEGLLIRATILSDTTPETFPTTGVGVDNLADAAKLDGGSVLIDLQASDTYILGNDGETWHKWGKTESEV